MRGGVRVGKEWSGHHPYYQLGSIPRNYNCFREGKNNRKIMIRIENKAN